MPHYAFRLGRHGGTEHVERSRVFAEDRDEAIEIALSWATHERRFWNERADPSNWPLVVWMLDGVAGLRHGRMAYFQEDVRPRDWARPSVSLTKAAKHPAHGKTNRIK